MNKNTSVVSVCCGDLRGKAGRSLMYRKKIWTWHDRVFCLWCFSCYELNSLVRGRRWSRSSAWRREDERWKINKHKKSKLKPPTFYFIPATKLQSSFFFNAFSGISGGANKGNQEPSWACTSSPSSSQLFFIITLIIFKNLSICLVYFEPLRVSLPQAGDKGHSCSLFSGSFPPSHPCHYWLICHS